MAGMVHQGQSLALGLEARDHFAGVHPGFDQLERHAAAHGLLLLRQPDLAHAAFADFLQQVITANHGAGSVIGSMDCVASQSRFFGPGKEGLHLEEEVPIGSATRLHKRTPLVRRQLQCLGENCPNLLKALRRH